MRLTSVYSLTCLCGRTVEWDSASPEAACPNCRRVLRVEYWPNTGLATIEAGGRE